MRKRRKHKAGQGEADDGAPAAAPKPVAVGTGLGALLERAGLSSLPAKGKGAKAQEERSGGNAAGRKGSPAAPTVAASVPPAAARPAIERPRAPYSTAELSALNQAYRGVAPIRRAKRARAAAKPPEVVPQGPDPADEAARARLAALVGGGVRFEVHWDDGFVQALRAGAEPSLLSRLGGARFAPEARLDLHGRRRAEAQRTLAEFVRSAHARGARRLLVIVGKGEHSEDGAGVLGAAALEVLTAGIAAPLVAAVASAHPSLGGRGALAVLLR